MTGKDYVVETCPSCEYEIEMAWDVERMGYKAYCPVCGNRLMICSECLDIHGVEHCDYCKATDTCRYNKEEKV